MATTRLRLSSVWLAHSRASAGNSLAASVVTGWRDGVLPRPGASFNVRSIAARELGASHLDVASSQQSRRPQRRARSFPRGSGTLSATAHHSAKGAMPDHPGLAISSRNLGHSRTPRVAGGVQTLVRPLTFVWSTPTWSLTRVGPPVNFVQLKLSLRPGSGHRMTPN